MPNGSRDANEYAQRHNEEPHPRLGDVEICEGDGSAILRQHARLSAHAYQDTPGVEEQPDAGEYEENRRGVNDPFNTGRGTFHGRLALACVDDRTLADATNRHSAGVVGDVAVTVCC